MIFDPRAEGILCYYKGKHLLSDLQLEGSNVGHSETLQGGFLHLVQMPLCTECVLFKGAE